MSDRVSEVCEKVKRVDVVLIIVFKMCFDVMSVIVAIRYG